MTTQRMPAVGATPELGGAAPRLVICSPDAQRRTLLNALARATLATAPVALEADCGNAALEHMRAGEVDCLITDGRLSGMSAVELLAQMRSEFEPAPPAIVLTEALTQQEAGALLRQQVGFVCPVSDPSNVGLRSALLSVLQIQQLRALLAAADAANRQQRDDLQGMQKLDPLTGLSNSQNFYEILEVEFRRSARSAQPLSLVVADIDCFTAYNYAYGQDAGDKCLQQIATALDGNFQRAGDLVARVAGAQFAVLLANTDNDDVAQQAERMRECAWDLEIYCNSSKVADRVTLSVGVATVNSDFDKGWEFLLQTAQNAMFHAKAQGRNWVEVAAGM